VQLGAADGRHGAVIGKPRRLGLVGKRQAPPSEPRRRAPNTPIRAVVAQVVARRSWKPRPTLPATSRSIAEDMKAIVVVRSRQRHLPLPRRRQRRHEVLRATLRAWANYRFDTETGHIAATRQPTRTHLRLVDPWHVYSVCMVLTKTTNPNCVAHPLNCRLLPRYRCQSSSSAGRKMQG
jgi:hypothetical protein